MARRLILLQDNPDNLLSRSWESGSSLIIENKPATPTDKPVFHKPVITTCYTI